MDTLLGVIAAAVLVLPGFVTQELSVRGRPSAHSDGQTIIQRALFYSVIIQIIWSWDTWQLIDDLTGNHWQKHSAEVAVWLLLVVVVSPLLLGLAINEILLRAESGGGNLTRFHYALGGRDAREAWDYFFQTLDRGAWVLIRLTESTPETPAMFIGRYGKLARHGQSPSAHDVYFDEVWGADRSGRPVEKLSHLSGMWLRGDQIEVMFPLEDDRPDTDPSSASTASADPPRIIFSLGRLVVGWGAVRLKAATTSAEPPTAEAASRIAGGSPSPLPVASQEDSSSAPAPLP